MYRIVWIVGLLLLMVNIVPVAAMPTINCHCFRDRSFDPQQPAAADGYFLATAQNSFFAAYFNISKKALVMKKQQGLSSENLWIAYWLAQTSGVSAQELLQRHEAGEAWWQIADSLPLPGDIRQGAVLRQLRSEPGNFHPDQLVVDQLLMTAGVMDGTELGLLRRRQATNQMVLLLLALTQKRSETASELFRQVAEQGRSWGELMQQAGLDSKQLLPLYRQLVPSRDNGQS